MKHLCNLYVVLAAFLVRAPLLGTLLLVGVLAEEISGLCSDLFNALDRRISTLDDIQK